MVDGFLQCAQISHKKLYFCTVPGEMPEWSIGAVSKTVVLSRAPGVRIPLSPQITSNTLCKSSSYRDYFYFTYGIAYGYLKELVCKMILIIITQESVFNYYSSFASRLQYLNELL
jgi:hypothetical protein